MKESLDAIAKKNIVPAVHLQCKAVTCTTTIRESCNTGRRHAAENFGRRLTRCTFTPIWGIHIFLVPRSKTVRVLHSPTPQLKRLTFSHLTASFGFKFDSSYLTISMHRYWTSRPAASIFLCLRVRHSSCNVAVELVQK